LINKTTQVLKYLRPLGGWAVLDDTYESIQFIDAEPFTEAEYKAALKTVDAFVADQEKAKATAKAELLARLGITEEEAKLLLS
jgi:hypothetical protein